MCFLHLTKGFCLFLAGIFLHTSILSTYMSIWMSTVYYALLILRVYHYCMSYTLPKIQAGDFQVRKPHVNLSHHADNSVLNGFGMGDRCSFFSIGLLELKKVFLSISSINAMWKNEHGSPIPKPLITELYA